MADDLGGVEGIVFDVDQTAVHDGPGVRMNVYLKGCPLRCDWCHSPDSQEFAPQIVWYESRCSRCGRCVETCPAGVRGFDLLDQEGRAACRLCGQCVEVCCHGALEVRGYRARAAEIADQAERLKPFFRHTGGGVTLTGGEPAAQPDFAFALASLCKSRGIHVALESCGLAPWGVFERLLPVVDLFLYDVKHVDDAMHQRHTGVSNGPILANLRRLAESGCDVVARVPLIPGFNDDLGTIKRIADHVCELGVRDISLLPFNPAAAGRYSWIRRPYPWKPSGRQSVRHRAQLDAAATEAGLRVIPA